MSTEQALGIATAAVFDDLRDIKRRTAHEEVRERLRMAILRGTLAPGTPLVFSELSERLGTSRTPVREAIRDLATEGLIDFDAYKSPVVHVPTLVEAREIYQLRIVLEGLAGREAVSRISASDLEEAGALCAAMEDAGDVGSWTEFNRRFHGVLTRSVPSKRLRELIGSLRDASVLQVSRSLSETPGRMREGNAEHRALLVAYRAGDADAVEATIRQHLLSTLRTIEDAAPTVS